MRGSKPKYTAADWALKFWAKVDRSAGPEACWIWLGLRHSITGRGLFSGPRPHYKLVQAHRYAYLLEVGPIPAGKFILHNCDNGGGGCVNPKHLYVGTQTDNMRDRKERSGPYVNGRGTGYRSKITARQVLEIRRLVNVEGLSRAEVGRQFGISRWQASTIASGKAWRKVPA